MLPRVQGYAKPFEREIPATTWVSKPQKHHELMEDFMEFLALDTGFSKHSSGGELMSDWVASDVSEKGTN
ncbi:Phd Finger Protein 23 [Manis pentadactyla]|nr:Phd Finger Protein 23 [Manis pentadactyla]